jgi:hypothetical protein
MSKNKELPTAEQCERVAKMYPVGTRLALTADLEDEYAPIKAGERGTVVFTDGDIGMEWDCGRSLKIIVGVDSFRKLTTKELIIEEINKVRFNPLAPNMFDVKAVFELAMELDCVTLANFIFMDTRTYSTLILTGELADDYEIPTV